MMFKFEQDADVEVVWNGGPLLPDRPTGIDRRVEGFALYYFDMNIQSLGWNTKERTRLYNKRNRIYWKERRNGERGQDISVAPNEHRPAREAGEAEATITGTAR